MRKTTVITLSKTDLEFRDGKWFYKILDRQVIDHQNAQLWESRAQELRSAGMKWREIAAILNTEGFTTKQGLPLSSGQILNRMWYLKK